MADSDPSPTTAQRVTASALRLFGSKGFQATGIRDIAEGAGMSSAALYYYMGTKEHLLLGIMRHALTAWYTATREVVDESKGPVEKLCNCIRVHVICSGLYTLESTVVDTETRSLTGDNRVEIVALRDRYERLMDAILRDGEKKGVFTISDLRLLRLGLLEMCNGVSRWYSPSGRLPIEIVADNFAEFSLAASRARRGTRHLRLADLTLEPSARLVERVRRAFEAESAAAIIEQMASVPRVVA